MGRLSTSRVLLCLCLVGIILVGTGCASSRQGGAKSSLGRVTKIGRDLHYRFGSKAAERLAESEGVMHMTTWKGGAFGFGLLGGMAAVYPKDSETRQFGPPCFIGIGGLSAGLGYLGLNGTDFVVLFHDAEMLNRMAYGYNNVSFANEVSLLAWGRKQMTMPMVEYYSNGCGLSVGFIELEFLPAGPRDKLHRALYGPDATVEDILEGNVEVPPELQVSIDNLNELASVEDE